MLYSEEQKAENMSSKERALWILGLRPRDRFRKTQLSQVAKRLETLIDRHEAEKNVTVEELIGPTKLAVQLLKTSLRGSPIKNDLVKIDSTVPKEVRQWLMSTFTPPKSSTRSVGESRRKGLKGIVAGISAAIRMEKLTIGKNDLAGFTDDIKRQLQEIASWNFDIFEFGKLTGNRPLRYILYQSLASFDLLGDFKIKGPVVMNFAARLEELYLSNKNPYHNDIHAADVTQALFSIIELNGAQVWLDNVELFAALFAAAIHDVSHTGTTNNFHIMTKSNLANLYNDRSVLENFHLTTGFGICAKDECNILAGLNDEQFFNFRNIVIDMVLATDMVFHNEHLFYLSDAKSSPSFADTTTVLGFMLHSADISHSLRPWKHHEKMVEFLFEEFFLQGDQEAKSGFPISPLCDRNTLHIPNSQISFNKYIIEPTFSALTEFFKAANECLFDENGILLEPSENGTGDSLRPGKDTIEEACEGTSLCLLEPPCAAYGRPVTPSAA
ncbi:Oidioi.mRNA.OKI2018_I69.chr2.g5356.t1.cds [Oikopleura dioica]|uniref:Phosphodiesterase n=1 Tax=Oikopleura dioica TaxID=34765 RepID=A0ABN7T997_OIKDI|nr:Oidioi.mRNA.OKI2018_I69.chr2.g5356.t1.cds [Oikopleura dioica]